MLKALVIFAALLASVSCRREETTSFEGRRISAVDIRFVGNVPPVDEARLRACMNIQSGDIYDIEQLDDDIRSLYESGLVEDVRVLAEAARKDVRIVFELTNRPPLGVGHHIIGNSAFSDQALANHVDFRSWITLQNFPESMRRRIERFYRSNGYPEARVRCEPQEDQEGYYNFIIEEG